MPPPSILVVSRPQLDAEAIAAFLQAAGYRGVEDWDCPDRHESRDAELLVEFGGRLCYDSFGPRQGTRGNATYLENLKRQAHGSVLEHAVWSFVISGVSRSLTHELVRHRAGTAFSQASQRYISAQTYRVVVPPLVEELGGPAREFFGAEFQDNGVLYTTFQQLIAAQLGERYPDLSTRDRRKLVNEAARSILPNATETALLFSANARALRWICVLRGGPGTDREIRRFAVALTRVLHFESPHLFGDLTIEPHTDGTEIVVAPSGEAKV